MATGNAEELSLGLYDERFTDKEAAAVYLENIRWPDGPVCPHCGGKLERVLSAPAVSFKGGGWYADGYGNAKPKSSGDGANRARDNKAGSRSCAGTDPIGACA